MIPDKKTWNERRKIRLKVNLPAHRLENLCAKRSSTCARENMVRVLEVEGIRRTAGILYGKTGRSFSKDPSES
jgi:hypothetical protein